MQRTANRHSRAAPLLGAALALLLLLGGCGAPAGAAVPAAEAARTDASGSMEAAALPDTVFASSAALSAEDAPGGAPEGAADAQAAQQSAAAGQDASGAQTAPENAAGVQSAAQAQQNSSGGQSVPQAAADAQGVSGAQTAQPDPADTSAQMGEAQFKCTVSISCAALLDNLDTLGAEKAEFVPPDGLLLAPVQTAFTAGESAFDALKRACRENGVHLEFSTTPVYNSAFIEGIGNLYEFDAGACSGWLYKVNDSFPGVSCSRCPLADGDAVCFVYTCDLGRDVGGYVTGGQRDE